MVSSWTVVFDVIIFYLLHAMLAMAEGYYGPYQFVNGGGGGGGATSTFSVVINLSLTGNMILQNIV